MKGQQAFKAVSDANKKNITMGATAENWSAFQDTKSFSKAQSRSEANRPQFPKLGRHQKDKHYKEITTKPNSVSSESASAQPLELVSEDAAAGKTTSTTSTTATTVTTATSSCTTSSTSTSSSSSSASDSKRKRMPLTGSSTQQTKKSRAVKTKHEPNHLDAVQALAAQRSGAVVDTSLAKGNSQSICQPQPGWMSAQDAAGRTYYYHTVTRETKWEHPSATATATTVMSSSWVAADDKLKRKLAKLRAKREAAEGR